MRRRPGPKLLLKPHAVCDLTDVESSVTRRGEKFNSGTPIAAPGPATLSRHGRCACNKHYLISGQCSRLCPPHSGHSRSAEPQATEPRASSHCSPSTVLNGGACASGLTIHARLAIWPGSCTSHPHSAPCMQRRQHPTPLGQRYQHAQPPMQCRQRGTDCNRPGPAPGAGIMLSCGLASIDVLSRCQVKVK